MSPRTAYYILEHPTRGLVSDIDWFEPPVKVRFTRADNRTDERVMRFYGFREAKQTWEKLFQEKGISAKMVVEIKLRREGDWAFYCFDCGGWVETKFGYEHGHKENPDCPMIGGG